MGGASSKAATAPAPAAAGDAPVDEFEYGSVPDASLSSDISTPEENAAKRKAYANLQSAYAKRTSSSWLPSSSSSSSTAKHINLIEEIYNEDFETIDHIQALRLPPMVGQQLRSTVRDEAERRCTETEKAMARCLQDKMWTSWKCQKERDTYYHCVDDIERRNVRPDPDNPDWVDMLTTFRWKYNLGVFHGEIIGRNNIMKEMWREHYPDRELPHPWVKDS